MRRLVFLFMSKSSATPYSTKRVKPTNPCGDYYLNAFRGECYFQMLEELLRLDIFHELFIFYESNINPGLADWIRDKNLKYRVHCEVIPEIRFVDEYINDDTVIFVRGGFKHWFEFLAKYKNKNWLMIYAANTGRSKWKFWDVILEDIATKNNYVDDHGRYHFKFTKPTNENLFFFKNYPVKIDVCIGASHIHDKKGQYHIVEAIKILKKDFNYHVNAVLPGSSRGGINSAKMLNHLSQTGVEYVGYLPKYQLSEIFNYSKLFVHMGNHGQNDRSLLEAFACGTPIIYKSFIHHDPELKKYCHLFEHENNHYLLAKAIKSSLDTFKQSHKEVISREYKKNFGFKEKVIPKMSKLLDFMFRYKPDKTSKTVLTKIFKGNLCDL